MRSRLPILVILLLTAVPLATRGAEPTGREVLQRAFEKEEAQEKLRALYYYQEHAERFGAGRDGKRGKLTFTRDFEFVYLEGKPYRRLVAMDGKPLNARQAAEEERKMRLTAAERKQEAAGSKQKSKTIPFCDVSHADVLRLLDHSLTGGEEIEGRGAWVIQSSPPDRPASEPGETKALSYRHTYWIDREDEVIAQERCEVVRPGVETMPGSWWKRVNGKTSDSPWFIRSTEGEVFAKDSKHWFQLHHFFGFRKFASDSTVTFTNP